MTGPDHPPLLFPPPRAWERLAGLVTLSDPLRICGTLDRGRAAAAFGADVEIVNEARGPRPVVVVSSESRDVPAQGYRLRARPGTPRVEIESSDESGTLHALSTLRQLVRQYGRTIPGLVIEDAPRFMRRGVMLDVSRDRVPTMSELLRVVDQLAELKINHLQLYTEHTFAYAGHEEVWRGWSPLTPAEIRDLDTHCRLRGITLAANQNCFGHLASWLRHARYAPLAEIQGLETPWKFYDFERRGPFSLCPTDPGSLALIRDLLSQALPCFSSNLVNINCDETADVGQGRSRDEVARRGSAAVYFDFVRAVASAARDLGARPMFWADIALSHPDSIALIPDDMICLAWGYEPDSPFDEWCSRLRSAGREVWVCPGTSSWRSVTGRTHERRANILAAAREGLRAGAAGLLVTDWGDLGHRQHWPISLHGVADGALAAWTGDRATQAREAESLQVLSDPSLRMAAWLDELGDADLELRRIGGRRGPDGSPTHLRNASVLFNDMHPPFEGADRVGSREHWASVSDRISELARDMPSIADVQCRDEIRHTLSVAAFAATRGVWRRSDPPSAIGAELGSRLRGLAAEHRRLWLLRSRPGGLDDSCGYFYALLDELEQRR